uniref:Formin-like protein 14 n=1 Tax=Rhizophora mucronata TaxID=61149 RepID=A0A2P2N003_RHIMU
MLNQRQGKKWATLVLPRVVQDSNIVFTQDSCKLTPFLTLSKIESKKRRFREPFMQISYNFTQIHFVHIARHNFSGEARIKNIDSVDEFKQAIWGPSVEEATEK